MGICHPFMHFQQAPYSKYHRFSNKIVHCNNGRRSPFFKILLKVFAYELIYFVLRMLQRRSFLVAIFWDMAIWRDRCRRWRDRCVSARQSSIMLYINIYITAVRKTRHMAQKYVMLSKQYFFQAASLQVLRVSIGLREPISHRYYYLYYHGASK